MTHPTQIAGLTTQELAKQVADLRYDALRVFLYELADKLECDADADEGRGRKKLSSALTDAHDLITLAGKAIDRAWVICEPHMNSV